MTSISVRESESTDPRVARTTHALGQALIELIQERDFDDITVQQILDRAGVGRATFYAHFRNKTDVLHSSYEKLFVAFEKLLDQPSPLGPRLFPVAEFLTHVAEVRGVLSALRRSGQWDEMMNACTAYSAEIIQRRLEQKPGSGLSPQLVARMLSGALVESMDWWQDHPDAASPVQMDAAFHRLAAGLAR